VKIFISYAHVDKFLVKTQIVDILRDAGYDAWFDEQLVVGQDWKQQLANVLQSCDAFVYAMTPESVESEWCQWEFAQAVKYGKQVVPVLLQKNTTLPINIKNIQYVDFSDGATAKSAARLIGGLQRLSPEDIPASPTNPTGPPPQAIDMESKKKDSHWTPPTIIGLILTLIATIVGIIAVLPDWSNGTTPQSATPATPIVVALRDLDIRSGPANRFNVVGVLAEGDSLDIMAIIEDRQWYQVLLVDGTYGWVIAGRSFGRFEGNPSVLRIVTPTATDSPNTSTHTSVPITLTPPTEPIIIPGSPNCSHTAKGPTFQQFEVLNDYVVYVSASDFGDYTESDGYIIEIRGPYNDSPYIFEAGWCDPVPQNSELARLAFEDIERQCNKDITTCQHVVISNE
jgi:hypothetical protein